MSPIVNSLLAVAAALCSGCSSVDPHIDELFEGTDAIRRDRCEVYRLHPGKPGSTGMRLHGFEVLDGPDLVTGDTRQELESILLTPDNYLWQPPDAVKSCDFEPALLFRFQHPQPPLDILYSFVCGRMMVYRGKRQLALQDADPMHNDLLLLARALFPNATYLRLMPRLENDR